VTGGIFLSDSTLGAEIKDWVISIVIAIILSFFIRYYIAELYMVDGPSMQPTLHTGERLIVNKFIYRFSLPEHGDVLVFQYPKDPSRDFIKRVIAVAGDTIEVKDGRVFVNSQLLTEPYILDRAQKGFPLSVVPPDAIFVMGDNRNNSEDSRFSDVGFVPYQLIKGKAIAVLWPLDQAKRLSLAP